MNLTGKQLRAIGQYARDEGLKLTLSTPPSICFLKDGELIRADLTMIEVIYEQKQKARAKERARERAREAREKKTDQTSSMRSN